MMRRFRKATGEFLFDKSFAPDRTTNMPFRKIRFEFGCKSGGDMLLRVPNCHQFHILNCGVIHACVVARLTIQADAYDRRPYRPLNRRTWCVENLRKRKSAKLAPLA